MSNPSQPDPSKLQRSTNPGRAEELDLWNLEEEEPSPPPMPSAAPATGDIPPMPLPMPVEAMPAHPSPAVSSELHGADVAPPSGSIPSLDPTPEEIAEIAAEASPAKAAEPESPVPAPTPAPAAPQEGRLPLAGIEKLSLLVFVVLVFGGGGIIAWSVYNRLPKKPALGSEVSYPVQGEKAEITKVETFWREPIRTGEARDKARPEVAVIPIAQVTLGSGKGSGALRFFYRNERKESVGDAHTLAFSGGKFTDTGSDTAEFPGTAGFNELGMFAAYATGQQDPWHLEILEGPSVDAPSGSFRQIALVPIRPNRR